jgi:hypothetical protein
VPGPAFDTVDAILSGEAPADEALTFWCDLFEEVSSKVRIGGQGKTAAMVQVLAEPWPPRLFARLYARAPQGEPIGFADLVKETLHDHPDEFPPNAYDLATQVVTGMGQLAFGYAAEHGGVQTSGDDAAVPDATVLDATVLDATVLDATVLDIDSVLDIASLLPAPPSRLRVRLTDLGRYAMRRQLLRRHQP